MSARTRTKPPTTSFQITSGQLGELVRPVVPLARRDHMMPLLTAIHFETIDGHLIASATDRFRVGFCREPVEGLKAGASMLLSIGDLKTILTVFKATRRSDPLLTLTIGAGSGRPTLTVEESGGMFAAASFTFYTLEGDYPKLRRVIEDAAAADPVENANVMNVNPLFLADFQHASRESGVPMVLRSYGASKPSIVTIGEHFVGAIMPMRDDGLTAAPPLNHWQDVFTAPKAATRKAS